MRYDREECRGWFIKRLAAKKLEAWNKPIKTPGDDYAKSSAHAKMLMGWWESVQRKDQHNQRDWWELGWIREELNRAVYVGD